MQLRWQAGRAGTKFLRLLLWLGYIHIERVEK
jgi:hypothetical protein